MDKYQARCETLSQVDVIRAVPWNTPRKDNIVAGVCMKATQARTNDTAMTRLLLKQH